MGEQSEPPTPTQETMGTFEEAARSHIKQSLSSHTRPTPCLARRSPGTRLSGRGAPIKKLQRALM